LTTVNGLSSEIAPAY